MIRVAHPVSSMPVISHDDVMRFSNVVTIRDEAGFAAALLEFYREKFSFTEFKTGHGGSEKDLRTRLKHKAAALKAKENWIPTATDLQRGRVQMLSEFNAPHNLRLIEFAALSNKSRQQIYKDIAAKRLLALSVGARGQRIPDWQLDDTCLELTRLVIAQAVNVDEWTLYHVLSKPLDALQGKSPVETVNKLNMNKVVSAALNLLGVHTGCP